MIPVAAKGSLTCVTWNVAAINNNPFEYWVTHDDAAYLKLMEDVQQFIDRTTPNQDVMVGAIFPDDLFEELAAAMTQEGWTGVEETRQLWKTGFSKRSIIGGFLKDKEIGAKRLASMPDRLTNSIDLASTGARTACRPSVISNFAEHLPGIREWWAAWKNFMFGQELQVAGKEGPKQIRPCQLLAVIPRSKYPALTEEEERISIPLQVLSLAIFDAILVHMLNIVAPSTWGPIKAALCQALCSSKASLTLRILEEQYSQADVIFLQEVSASMIDAMGKSPTLSGKFHILVPAGLDRKRDQNSMVLASRELFSADGVQEVTSQIAETVSRAQGAKLAAGDLCALVVSTVKNPSARVLLASFHGDTDGLLTPPVIDALLAHRGDFRVLFGIDANAHSKGVAGKKLGAADFRQHCVNKGLEDCWSGRAAEAPNECFTTYNARTFLQPQLNKAVSREAAGTDPSTDRNPKDYILFDPKEFKVEGLPERDNTGRRGIFHDQPFPTLQFPSDHAAVLSRLQSLL
eukprot:TRINITY_DN7651_c0_g2_i1.p1 TRINITY_DN7651_c0_g2~~TRINITY_DN7651_c0_g2_i1.p1  ORF type:complete len:533 (+),score=100.69 TRINITY_DN7651_c0_g2_i1:47-1600(+)